MSEDPFIKLVQDNDGLEFYQAFQNDVDHVFGGKGNIYWYTVLKKRKVLETYIGKQKYGVTIAYSDIKDAAAGFHLRYVYIGNEVEVP